MRMVFCVVSYVTADL